MNEYLLNGLALSSVVIVIVLWIKESLDHAGTRADYDDLIDQVSEMDVTIDRYYKEKIEAQAIADHAIDVLVEAREITMGTIRAARVNELARAFIDRRQREQNEKDLQD